VITARDVAIGINVYYTRWIAFVISGLLGGRGGALFALFRGYGNGASRRYMFYHVSRRAVVLFNRRRHVVRCWDRWSYQPSKSRHAVCGLHSSSGSSCPASGKIT